ncbi:MAG: flagellar biosynthesis protein FlhB [Nitrospira sp.]|jgi:flagellar biosynthetic protein FlhB|nr:flagellar biosynthesis protein FlhB [Nitrospira sp.]MDR4472123.1 flagellar biosynthesis protein FlhB [Nitrospira sp.]MDR4476610.1 flagellar biosynthesis protein FlhB [Nitrospira sp.]HAP40075.1 flagellar biosynthesis protein FlhB [Nitrospira sp.]
MADSAQNRTEKATPKRKSEARAKGQIALSRDAAMAVALLGGFGALYWMTPAILNGLRVSLQAWLSRSMEEATHQALSLDHLHLILRQIGVEVFVMLGPVVAGIAVVGVGANLMQTGLFWKQDGFSLDWSRISPMGGFSRLFSPRSIVELIKSWLKILAIGGVGYLTIKQDMQEFISLTQFGMESLLPTVGWATIKAALTMSGAELVIGAADYGYQRFQWERDLRMSRDEIKEESRAAEGDPGVKSKIRTTQREMSRKRMMAAVPTADVIITNPTHLAVALKYDAKANGAPVVVAKGAGFVAEKIREIARQHGVMIVENKLVARTLYKLVEVGREVPEDLYRAVAEILAFVYRVRGKLPPA